MSPADTVELWATVLGSMACVGGPLLLAGAALQLLRLS